MKNYIVIIYLLLYVNISTIISQMHIFRVIFMKFSLLINYGYYFKCFIVGMFNLILFFGTVP